MIRRIARVLKTRLARRILRRLLLRVNVVVKVTTRRLLPCHHTLGARGGGLGWYITRTSQGHGQSTRQKPTWHIPSTFRIFQPVSLQCSWVRKWSVHSQCSRSCDQGVPIRNTMGTFKIFPKKVPRIFLSGPFRMFPVPGSGNGQDICSVPGHVTRVFPSGTLWEHSKFSQRKYPEFA